MANYTMTLYDLLDDPFYELFDFDYPFYTDDETRKKEFEQKFIMNYMRYEIGFETAYSFKQELRAKLHITMPYYKQLYESELKAKGIEFLLNKDLVEEFTRTLNQDASATSSTDSNSNSKATSSNSGTTNSNNENSSSDLDNGLSNADADKRKTSHSKDNSTMKSESQDTSNVSSTDSNVSKTSSEALTQETTRFVSRGNIGTTSSAELLEKWRGVMINIDKMLIDECRDLFSMIYFSFSIDDNR